MRVPCSIALIAVLALLSTACVRQRQYRFGEGSIKYEAMQTRDFDPRQRNNHALWPYRVAFLEFDERGEFFERAQLSRVLGTISAERARASDSMSARKLLGDTTTIRPIVVLFVHGWKHNASEKSANVWGFRQFLAGISAQFSSAPVVGVYVGWRGATISAPILKELTFFDRHQKSQALANADLTASLISVMEAAKAPLSRGEPAATTLLFGHSFGGAVLESALTATLSGLVAKASDVRTIAWPADLIVYVNQAQEADRSYQLIEAMHDKGSPRDGSNVCRNPAETGALDGPAILSISSTADYATAAAFPMGKALLRPFQSLRKYDKPNFLGLRRQATTFFNPTAHLSEFHTHIAGPSGDPRVRAATDQCLAFLRFPVLGVDYTVVESPSARNRTPYWVIAVPPSIIPDHGTIFTPVFRNLLAGMLFGIQDSRR